MEIEAECSSLVCDEAAPCLTPSYTGDSIKNFQKCVVFHGWKSMLSHIAFFQSSARETQLVMNTQDTLAKFSLYYK